MLCVGILGLNGIGKRRQDRLDRFQAPERCPRTQRGAHPRAQLGAIERLGDEVGGSSVEPRNLVGGFVQAADEDDRKGGHRQVGAKAPGEFDPVDAWHLDVGHDQVGLMGVRLREGLLTVLRLDEAIPVAAEDRNEQGASRWVVVGDQDAGDSVRGWPVAVGCWHMGSGSRARRSDWERPTVRVAPLHRDEALVPVTLG